jgi:hypothetical protein
MLVSLRHWLLAPNWPDSIRVQLWRGSIVVLVFGVGYAVWFAWFRIDWFEIGAAAAPRKPVLQSGSAFGGMPESLALTEFRLGDQDPRQTILQVSPSEVLPLSGWLRTDSKEWLLPYSLLKLPADPSRVTPQDHRLPMGSLLVVAITRSWTEPDGKPVEIGTGHLAPIEAGDAVRFFGRYIQFPKRPGRYLGQLIIGKRYRDRLLHARAGKELLDETILAEFEFEVVEHAKTLTSSPWP